MTQRVRPLVLMVMVFAAGFVARGFVGASGVPDLLQAPLAAQAKGRVFEIRTYTAPEGKLADLHARFRTHTMRIFAKHGMTSVGYFAPQDTPLSGNTLIYVISHESREAAKKNWDEFRADPEWQKVAADSQKNGAIVSKVESVFADATDYSPLK